MHNAQVYRAAAEHNDNAGGSLHPVRELERQLMFFPLTIAILAALPVLARAQWVNDSGDSSGTGAGTAAAQPAPPYMRPTQAIKLHNYLFDAFGPYPIVGAALVAGI